MTTRRLSVWPFVLVAIALCVSVSRGQQQSQAPTFRTGVDLVTVDVSVLDSDGRPVLGLGAEDFEIKLDGKVQPVRVVTVLQARPTGAAAPAPAGEPAPAPTGEPVIRRVFTNEAPPSADSRLIVFMVDDLSFSFARGKELFVAAEGLIESLPEGDLVGFTTSSGSQVVNPTTDHEVVRAAMAKAVGQFLDPRSVRPGELSGGGGTIDTPDSPVGLQQALAIERGDNATWMEVVANECFAGDRTQVEGQTRAALLSNDCVSKLDREIRQTAQITRTNTARQAGAIEAVLKTMKPVGGLKQLMLMTDGLAMDIDIDVLKPLALAAAEAGVQISVLSPEPDFSMTDAGRRERSEAGGLTDVGMARRRRDDSQLLLNGAQTMAGVAGGQFYRVIGDADPLMERAALAGSVVYRLGVEAPKGSEPGKDYRLEAKLASDRKGLSVHANRHAVFVEPEAVAAPPSPNEVLRRAVGAGQSLYGVPLKVGTSIRQSPPRPDGSAPPAPLELAINVEVPATVNGPLMTMFGLVNEASRNGEMSSGQRPVASPTPGEPFLISFSLPVTAGSYQLRFAAADAEGAVGALTLPVKAELATIGPFHASDLLTAWVDAQGRPQLFTLDTLPKAATSMQASVELYPVSGTLPDEEVFVQWTLTKAGDAFPLDDREVTAERLPTSLRAATEFLFDGFGSGTFTIRGRIRMGDTDLGTIQTTIAVGS